MKGGVLPQVKGVGPACRVRFPRSGEPRSQLGIGIELGEVVEEQRNDLTSRDVSGERRIQRPRIIREVVGESCP
jgi:hypothetical protein